MEGRHLIEASSDTETAAVVTGTEERCSSLAALQHSSFAASLSRILIDHRERERAPVVDVIWGGDGFF